MFRIALASSAWGQGGRRAQSSGISMRHWRLSGVEQEGVQGRENVRI